MNVQDVLIANLPLNTAGAAIKNHSSVTVCGWIWMGRWLVHVLCISVFVQCECAYIKSPTVGTEPILSFSESLEKTAKVL